MDNWPQVHCSLAVNIGLKYFGSFCLDAAPMQSRPDDLCCFHLARQHLPTPFPSASAPGGGPPLLGSRRIGSRIPPRTRAFVKNEWHGG